MLINWDFIYTTLGIKEFIYFISSPTIQETLFPVKIVFIAFTIFFFCAVMYFYSNSSYLQYKFLQDMTEFVSKENYELRKVSKNWQKIKKRANTTNESELKLAVIEADDFLYETFQDNDYKGDTFEELVDDAAKKSLHNREEVLSAHATRNSIVYEPDYKLDVETAKRLMTVYENTIKNVSIQIKNI